MTPPAGTFSPTWFTTTTIVYIRHSTTAPRPKSASAIVKVSPSWHETRCPVFGDNLTVVKSATAGMCLSDQSDRAVRSA